MIVVMKPGASEAQIDHVLTAVRALGYEIHQIRGEQRTVIACVGDERASGACSRWKSSMASRTCADSQPYKLAGTEWKRERTTMRVTSRDNSIPPSRSGTTTSLS